MKSTKVYIDGENLLHVVAHVLIRAKLITHKRELKQFPVRSLLERAINLPAHTEILYYGTKLREMHKPAELHKKSLEIIAQNRTIVAGLHAENVTYVRAGNLVARKGQACKECGHQEYVFREKGVDVRMAVDFLIDTVTKRTQEIIVVSSDSDLLPAMSAARQFATVRYVGFDERLNIEMAAFAHKTNTYTATQIERIHKALKSKK